MSTQNLSSKLSSRDKISAATLIFGVGLVVVLIIWPEAKDSLFSQAAAAWLQALGSIAALVVAIWVTRSGDRDRRDRALRAGLVYGHQLLLRLNEAVEACEGNHVQRMKILCDVFTGIQAMGHDVPVADIPSSNIDDFMNLRLLNFEAGWTARTAAHMDAELGNWHYEFRTLRDKAEARLASYCGSK